MTPTKRSTWQRPLYFRGQLLDETDFQAEQDYHRNARLAHNLRLHSWGVVQGLTVSRHSDTQVSVAAGMALDSLGRELIVEELAVLQVSDFGPNQTVFMTLSYEEGAGDHRKSEHGEGQGRMTEYSVLSTSATGGAGASVTLATVRLDSNGKVGAISYSQTKYASSVLAPASVGYRELADNSITPSKLAEGVISGWLRMCVKPFPLEDKKPFRVGPTEARSTDEGAAGSIAIPAPPGMSKVTRFRIAGELNEGIIRVQFYRCGWDPTEKDHEKTSLLKKPLEFPPSKAFEHTWPAFDSPESFEFEGRLDPRYHALSVVIEVTKKTSISLLAVEFKYEFRAED
jgi:hypothetical protein